MIKPASEALASKYEEDTLHNPYKRDSANNYDRTVQLFRQCTIKCSVTAVGIGRDGQSSTIILRPAPMDTGIIFRRIDTQPVVKIALDLASVQSTCLQVNLVEQGIILAGIEHLLSAIAGLGIDNLYIDVNHTMLPIMDGSAEPFVFLIQSAGIKQQSALKRFIRVQKKVQIVTNNAWVTIEPSTIFQITCMLSAHKKLTPHQQYSTTITASIYTKTLSRARHIIGYQPINMRRYDNECIRHHVLDTVGDLYTLGYGIVGAFTGYNTNHLLNNHLMRKLLANPQTWELVEYPLEAYDSPKPAYY